MRFDEDLRLKIRDCKKIDIDEPNAEWKKRFIYDNDFNDFMVYS